MTAAEEGIVAAVPAGVQDRYVRNEILGERIGEVGPDGEYERVRIVKTGMKYPLVRVVERFQGSGFRGQEKTGVLSSESAVPPGPAVAPLNPVRLNPEPRPLNPSSDTLLSQTAMVADHVTLKVTEGTTEAQLASYAQAHGGTILRKLRVPGPGTYLVKFDTATVDTVPNAVAALSQPSAPVQYVNPDYVAYADETIPNDPLFSQLFGMHNTSHLAASGTVVSAATAVSGLAIIFSPVTNGVTGTLYYCGLGNPEDFPAAVSNNIALIQRGTLTFAQKATNAKAKGAKAVVIYNNAPGSFSGTFSTSGDWLPSLGISDADGATLMTQTNTSVTVSVYGCKFDADIDAPEAWDISTGSTNIVVAVIDTGVDYNHPDLRSNMWVNAAEKNGTAGVDDDGNGFIDDVYGYDFANDDGNPMDDHFHGTHCAGTIGGVGNNAVGVAGVCWNVRIMGLKFLDAEGGGSLSAAMEAVYYATSNGVKLTSNSWGGGGFDQGLRDAIADAGNRGILFVAAAGNSAGNNDANPTYPGSYDCSNIITVAATDWDDAMASFSCYGLTSVDIGAPGVSILSTYPTYMTAAMIARGDPTNYASISGTSMATPHVAGACALMAAAHPELTAAQVRALIMVQSDPVPALAGKCVTGGRLNIGSAITLSQVPLLRLWQRSVSDPAPGGNADGRVNPGETVQLAVSLINGGMNTATGVVATLTTTNEMVTVVSNTATFGDIPSLSDKQASDVFRFSVSSSCPPGLVTFEMVVTDSAGSAWTNMIQVRVRISTLISGVVTLDGSPAPDYKVYCYGTDIDTGASIYQNMPTDSQGQYAFNLFDGTYTLYAVHPTIYYVQSPSTQVTTPPDATNVNFNLTSVTLSGRVTDGRTGNPLTAATVDYYVVGDAYTPARWQSWVLRGATTVDTNGCYSFTTVVASTSIVSVASWMPGYSNPAPREVILPPGTQDVDFAMFAPDVNIGVTPVAVAAAGVIGQTVTQALTVANSGAGNMPWTLWNESDEGNATAGQVVRQFTLPSETYIPAGVAFDGSALCIASDNYGMYGMSLNRLNPDNGALLNAWNGMEMMFNQGKVMGWDWDGVNYWTGDWTYKRIQVIDPATRKMVKSLNIPDGSPGYPYGAVIGGGYLWVLNNDGSGSTTGSDDLLKMDPRTGAVVATWRLPAELIGTSYGLEYFSGALWVTRWGNARIYKINPTNGRVIRSFAAPTDKIGDLAKSRSGQLWLCSRTGITGGDRAYLMRIGTAPWLANSVSSGTAPGGGSNTVQLTFNTTTAGVGIHTALVSVATSDPDEPEKLVPVIFTVTQTQPPVIDTPAAATPNPVLLPATAALSVAAHDPDGDPLTYTWSTISGPGTTTFTPNGTAASANSAAGFSRAGTYVLRVTVVSTNRAFEQATSDVTVRAVGIETDVAALTVPEGSNNTFRVRLVVEPAGSVTVAVAQVSGDADITVAGGTELVFDTGNWSAWQPVTLAASADEDIENGSAAIALSAAGFVTVTVAATEREAGTVLQVNAGPGGTAVPAGRNIVSIGVPVEVAATADATHTFKRWVTTAGTAVFADPLAATTTVTVTGPATIRANFSPAPGTAWAWGYNGYGQVGDGTTANRSSPVRVNLPGGAAFTNGIAAAAGWYTSFAVREDGTVWAWGWNDGISRFLGDGTTVNRSNPVQLSGIANITAIDAGWLHTVALRDDGTVWTWGNNSKGQLGNGTKTSTNRPARVVGISNVTAIAAGVYSTVALTSDSNVWMWGYSTAVGGIETNILNPVRVEGISNVMAIAAGYDHTLALKPDGSVWGWGYNFQGAVGDGTTSPRYAPVPTLVTNAVAIASHYMTSFAIKGDGTLWAWGNNINGQLGDGTVTGPSPSYWKETPVQALISNVVSISSGTSHTLATKGDGTVWAWGANENNQLGDGTTVSKPAPVQVPGLRDALCAAAGYNHSIILKEEHPYISVTTGVSSVSVPEGGTNTFQARLSAQPWTNVTVTVIRESGDGDISVLSTNTLAFTTNNWNTWQTVTLAADEDADAINGTAVIWLSGADVDARVTVTEVENDTTLNVYAGPNGAVSPNGATVVTKGATNTVAATANGGYYFANWSVIAGQPTLANANAATTTVIITSNATVQANFVAIPAVTCSITAPADGVVVKAGTNLQIAATASSYTGSVTKVDFYRDGVWMAEDLGAHYSCVWSNVPLGSHALTAMATDNYGSTGVSATVSIIATASGSWEGVVASGGTVTNYVLNGTNYRAHIFTTAGRTNLQVTSGGLIEVLVIGGGGGSGINGGGGGGAGGVIYSNFFPVAGGSNYTVTVGVGGAGGGPSANGSNSVFAALTAVGGGGGGSRDSDTAGHMGGSGGGGGGSDNGGTKGTGTAGQGRDGGNGAPATGGSSAGGGGGGYASAGTVGASKQGGNGGNGYWSAMSGVYTGYCGGGAGSGLDYSSYGGKAGTVQAGAGGGGPQNGSRNGRPSSGGGGGSLATGLNSNDSGGGSGGSGIVIVRYVIPALPAAPTGLTATTAGKNRIELAWPDNASDETGYVVDRSLDSNAWVFVTLAGVNATNHSDTGLTTNTLYYYRVAASNAAGLSAYGYASATTWTDYEAWRRAYFTIGELGDPAISGDDADPDLDHFSNLKEYLANTIPTNGLSLLVMTDVAPNPGAPGEFIVRWQSASNRWYTLQAATNLITGFNINLRTNIPATPMENVYTDSVESAIQKFYRVKVEQGRP